MGRSLYLAHDPDADLYKIGISDNVRARILSLQNRGALRAKLIKSWPRATDAREVEGLVKCLLSRFCQHHGGIATEWFSVPRAEIDAAIECALLIADRCAPREILLHMLKLPYKPKRKAKR